MIQINLAHNPREQIFKTTQMVDEFLEENAVNESMPNIQEHMAGAPNNFKSYLGPSSFLRDSSPSSEGSNPMPVPNNAYQAKKAIK